MIRLGLLDFDSSHSVEFTRRLNRQGIAEDQWVQGAEVVVACPGESRMMPERIPGYRREIEALGVPLVHRPEEMIGRVDGMLIVSQEGGVHYDRARPFLEARIPCFIDKPFACSGAEARRLADLARRLNVPVFSTSALRYAPEVTRLLEDPACGRVLGLFAYGPGLQEERNPGLFHYGIHTVEMLYAFLGPGCVSVSCLHERDVDVVTGRWGDGRLATVRCIRPPEQVYGFTVFTDRGVRHGSLATGYVYRQLLERVVAFFQTGRPPVPLEVTVEIMEFLDASGRSAARGGRPEVLAEA